VRYYRERVTDRNLSTPHSLFLQVLGELGIVGALLLGGALVAAVVALLRGWATATSTERRWASGLAAAGTVALSQQAVDWLWLIPGVTGLGVVCVATAVAIVALPRAPDGAPRSRVRALAGRVPFAFAAILVALVFMSDAYTRAARADGTAGRLSKARTAQSLDPYALAPRYLQAGALEEKGDVDAARRVLRRALDVEPTSFTTMALIGDLETRAGRPLAAKAWYRRALALNPVDAGLQQLAR
jgi:tetratricopeptide (TPR) repeat protein